VTTGNTAALTVSTAAAAPPDVSQSDCEKLGERNEDERKKATKGLKAEASKKGNSATRQGELDDALDKAQGGGMTFSSAMVSVGTSSGSINGVATASSSGKAAECTTGKLLDGGTSGMKTGHEPVLCKPPKYEHAEGGSGAHAEAKIFNELTDMAGKGGLQGGRVLLNIDWRYSRAATGKNYRSGMPCRSCFRMLCHAAKHCKIEIQICDKENKPQSLKDECDDPDGYEKLDKKIDHWSTEEQRKNGWCEVP
jgi:hypothetical protein